MNIIKKLNKWRDILYSWTGRLAIFKMSVLPNLIFRFNAISIEIPASYFVNIDKLILKFLCKGKRQNSQHTTEEQSWRTDTTQLQDFKDFITKLQ